MDKKLMIITSFILLSLFILPVISSFDFDNEIFYSNNDLSIEINDCSLWIGTCWIDGDKILDATLTSHTSINDVITVAIGEDKAVMYYEFNTLFEVVDGLGSVKFIDKNTNKVISKDYYFAKAIYETRSYTTTSETCVDAGLELNGSRKQSCTYKPIVHTYQEIARWERLPDNNIPKGINTIGLITDVNKGDTIDGIWTIAGKEIIKHAVWTSNLNNNLLAYYRLDETTYNIGGASLELGNATDYVMGKYNATTSWLNSTNGIIANAVNFTYPTTSNSNLTLPNNLNFSTQNMTLSFWVYLFLNESGNDEIYTENDVAGSRQMTLRTSSTNHGWEIYVYNETGTGNLKSIGNPINKTSWTNFVIQISNDGDGNITVWQDGIAVAWNNTCTYNLTNSSIRSAMFGNTPYLAGDSFQGRLDEIGIWNDYLTPSQIQTLYNNRNPPGYLEFYFEFDNISLINPINETLIKENNYGFTGYFNLSNSLLPSNANLTNATLYIWHNNGSLLKTNFTLLSNLNNQTNLTISGLSYYHNYWNYYTCATNYTDNLCAWGDEGNYTLYYNPFVYSQNGSLNTGEGVYETFVLKINSTSPSSMEDLNAKLWWNGTNQGVTTKNIIDANTVEFYKSFVIPNGTGNLTGSLINWYWQVNTTGEFSFNTTTQNQTVKSISISDCSVSAGKIILNLTLRDEETNTLINITSPNTASIELDLIVSSIMDDSVSWNFSKKWIDNQSVAICVPNELLNSTSYKIDFVVGYDATDHVQEFYFMDNGTLDNTDNFNSYTDNTIDLMDLLTTDSTTFLFSFTNENGLDVEDAIVHTFRNYIGEGLYREVERSREDNSGQTHIHLVEEDVIYYFIVTQYGNIIYQSGTYNAKCLSTPCEISLTASPSDTNWSIIDNEGGSYSVSIDKSSRIVTTEFEIDAIDLINVSLYKIVSGNATLINTTSVTATTGSLDMHVPLAYGNNTFFVAIYRNNSFIKSEWISIKESGKDYFGTTGAILGGMIILSLLLMAVSEGAGLVIFAMLGVFIIGIMQLVDLGWMALISIICAGGIIVWKLVSRRNRLG